MSSPFFHLLSLSRFPLLTGPSVHHPSPELVLLSELPITTLLPLLSIPSPGGNPDNLFKPSIIMHLLTSFSSFPDQTLSMAHRVQHGLVLPASSTTFVLSVPTTLAVLITGPLHILLPFCLVNSLSFRSQLQSDPLLLTLLAPHTSPCICHTAVLRYLQFCFSQFQLPAVNHGLKI